MDQRDRGERVRFPHASAKSHKFPVGDSFFRYFTGFIEIPLIFLDYLPIKYLNCDSHFWLMLTNSPRTGRISKRPCALAQVNVYGEVLKLEGFR